MRDYQVPTKWFYNETKAEASKYNSITAFAKGCRGAYKSALKRGWLDEFFPEKNNHTPYTFEEFLEKQSEINIKVRFKEQYPSLYSRARLEGWLDKVSWVKPEPKTKIDRNDYVIYAYEDNANKVVYVGLTFELEKRHKRHQNGTCKKGVRKFDVVNCYFNGNLPLPIVKMDGLNTADAGYYEDWYKNAYKNAGWRVLNIAKTGEGISSIGGNGGKWTDFETTQKEASKYKSRTDFFKKNGSAYSAAKRYGWMDVFFPKAS